MTRIIIFNDGYHTPTCVSENKDFFYGEEELIKLLCKPHTETYVTKTLQFECLDYDIEADIIECLSKEGLNHPEFHTLFNKIWDYKGDAIYEL